MSPETTTNQQIDHRSDLFSLGVILYLLCSGYMPFTGREPKEIVKKIRAGQYKPLQEIVAIPERLALLVDRLLAPNPDDRPQRGQEVAAELTEISRQYGIESSGANIAYILKQLFPNEIAGVFEAQAPSIREIVIAPDLPSTGSLSPNGETAPITGPRSRQLSAQPENVAVARVSAPIVTPSVLTPVQVPSVRRTHSYLGLAITIAVVIAIAIAIMCSSARASKLWLEGTDHATCLDPRTRRSSRDRCRDRPRAVHVRVRAGQLVPRK